MMHTMPDTNIGDPVVIRTGTRKELGGFKTYLQDLGIYNTVEVQQIAGTGQYLLVAQNRYVLCLNGKRD